MNDIRRQVLSDWLVLQAQGGDERAFRRLHELWAPDLLRFARARVGDDDGAAEVAQETWIAIARSLRRLDDPACFARWACQITVRRAADWIRRRQRERRKQAALKAEPESTPAGPAEESGMLAALRTAIAHLEAGQREILQLFYTAEMSVAEIGEALGIPPGTVKSRLFTAREKLKQQLERNTS
jgi:RNA polymerase sigma factor (sigma-70 family)